MRYFYIIYQILIFGIIIALENRKILDEKKVFKPNQIMDFKEKLLKNPELK
jgi:hypothetical protein